MKKIFVFRPAFDRNSTTMRGNNKPPTTCLCCHVHIGTISYAIVNAGLALFGIVFATLALTGLIQAESIRTSLFAYHSEFTPTQTYWVVFVNGVFLLLISTFCIYGVAKKRAGFILPFFIVQLFDFLCTVVYFGSVVFFWPQYRNRLAECPRLPENWKEALMNMDERWLACIIFLSLLVVIFVKCYFISMVYRSYKHTTLQVIMRRGQSEINFVSGNEEKKSVAIHIYNPPKYDDIQKVPLIDDAEDVDSKPPPYETV